jgi:hypothetical protein
VDLRCKATGGSAEVLRFSLPSEVTGAQLSGAARLEAVALPGQSRQHLIASLLEPRTGEFSVRLIVPLGSATSERLQVPEIRLLDAERVEAFVALPAQAEGQDLAWETRGLQAAQLPPDDDLVVAPDAQIFSAAGGRFQATLKRFDRIAGVPQVRLAEVTLHYGDSVYGVATFDLEPAGLSSCRLKLAGKQSLVHVTVGGTPAMVRPVGGNEYEIALHHQRLPQHLEVLFTDIAQDVGARSLSLDAPVLANLPVERTLWTLHSPVVAALLPLADEPIADEARQASLQLKNAAALLEHAAAHTFDSDAQQTAAWFAQWRDRTARRHADIERSFAELGIPEALSAERESLVKEAQTIAQQWGASDEIAATAAATTEPRSLGDVASTQSRGDELAIRTILSGSTATLDVQRTARAHYFDGERVAAVLVVAGLLCCAMALAQARFVAGMLDRSPHFAGVAIGITWWFLLSPAIVGLLLALIFAVASLRWPWPKTPGLANTGFTLSLPANRPR